MEKKLVQRLAIAALAAAIPAVSASAAPVNDWSFDENTGTSAADTGPDGAVADTGTLTGGPSWGTGALGTPGLIFDGSDDYVAVADSSDIDLGSGDFTIAFWMKMDSLDRMFAYSHREASKKFVAVEWTGSAINFEAEIGDPPLGPNIKMLSSTLLETDTLYHVAIVADRDSAANSKIYINGVDDTSSSTMTEDDLTFGGALSLGRWQGDGFYWDGMLDEIQVYDTALTQQEVAALVPEPASGVMALVGLGAIAMRRRRG